MNLQKLNVRTYTIIGFLLTMMVGFVIALVNTQIVKGQYYAELKSYSISKVPIKAARGVILDRNGVPMVLNESSLSLVFESPFFPVEKKEQQERNQVLDSLIKLFEKEKAAWIDELPIALNADGTAYFLEGRERDIQQMKGKDYLILNEYATAQNCMDALVRRYQLQDYPIAQARKLASVQYNMWRMQYSAGNPYTFAEHVTDSIKAQVKENSVFYRGVQTEVVPIRTYADGTVAPHILGRVSSINKEDYEKHKAEGYKLNDEFGAFGIERYAESWLRGTDGQKNVTINNVTGAAEESVEKSPQQGKTVVLTIDNGLQKMIEQSFPKRMQEMAANRHPGVPIAGAIIVLDARTNEILACVSYPGYDITKYSSDFAALNANKSAPLWNRALQGTYEPGSTIKVSVALAALQEGLISEDSTVRCNGVYPYLSQVFHCPQSYLHGGRPVNVVRALVDSCNIFFYQMGRQLGWEKINAYRLAMGLGQKTGVELPEEIGVMDSPERRQAVGQMWYPGYNLQTAIGQGNLFSPMQMAVYASTIANSGVRRRVHFIQSIRDASTNELIESYPPEVLGTTGVGKAAYDTVRKAMLEMGSGDTTAGRIFKGLPVKVAAKSGTSQVKRMVNGRMQNITNGLFISFAPFDNPEIVVIGVGEGCKSSKPVVPIVRDVYAYYFSSLGQMEKSQAENTLLG